MKNPYLVGQNLPTVDQVMVLLAADVWISKVAVGAAEGCFGVEQLAEVYQSADSSE